MASSVLPRVSVIVAARTAPETIGQALDSLAAQTRAAEIEVILADGSDDGCMAALVTRFPGMIRVALPGGNLPELKGAGIQRARGSLVAILDPSDAADTDWVEAMLAAICEPDICAAGGAVVLSDKGGAGNVAAYLFEYGAFNPPLESGDTQGDLPGNNVAYRRGLLLETCADILANVGFYKPLIHERLRARGGRLVISPAMRVRHLTHYAFMAFGVRRFHYGRCFGAMRLRAASPALKVLYRAFAPAVPPLLIARHLARAWSHLPNRRMLPDAALALCGVCAFWGVGEWLGYWFGDGRSCRELY